MTTTTHVYAARTGTTVLGVKGGSIRLDSTAWPHVQASIGIVRPTAARLALLDPRQSPAPRVQIDVTQTGPTGTVSRTFDLSVRDWDADQGGDLLTLTLASDEALADDYRPLNPIPGFWLLGSMKSLVDNVLAQVPSIRRNWAMWVPSIGYGDGSGHDSESGGFGDPWIANPGTAGAAGTINLNSNRGLDARLPAPNMTALALTWTTGQAATTGIHLSTGLFPIRAGWTWTASLYGACSNTASTWGVRIRWYRADSTQISDTIGAPSTGADVKNRWTVTGVAPSGATQARIMLTPSTFAPAAGTVAWITGALMEHAPSLGPWMSHVVAPGIADGTTFDKYTFCYWPATNLITNPTFETNTVGWEAHSNVGAITRVSGGKPGDGGGYALRFTRGATGYAYVKCRPVSVSPGRPYMASLGGTLGADPYTGGTNSTIFLRFIDGDERTIKTYSYTSFTHDTLWYGQSVSGIAPPGAVSAVLIFGYDGSACRIDNAAIIEQADPGTYGQSEGYFAGDTPNSIDYTYTWTETAHASVSVRTPTVERPPELLTWRRGMSAIEYLAPILQAAGLRLVCDEQRVWSIRSTDHIEPGTTVIRYGVNMVQGSDQLHRDDWFDAAIVNYTWRDQAGTEQRRTDTYALSGASKMRTFERDSVYPGPGFAKYAVLRRQGRGRLVTATAVADWTAVAEQGVSISLEALPIQTGTAQAITFNLDRDEMTVTARTGDTRPGSIDALTGTTNALAGTINGL